MPTTPSPYRYNRARYAKVSPRAQSGKSGCAIVALLIVMAPVLGTILGVTYFVA